MKDIYIGQVLKSIKNHVEYIVIDKKINGSDSYYDYLVLTKLHNFKYHKEIDSDYLESFAVGEDWSHKLEDFIITNEKYSISKIYRIC